MQGDTQKWPHLPITLKINKINIENKINALNLVPGVIMPVIKSFKV